MTKFAAIAPKMYGYRLESLDNKTKDVVKAKGITMTADAESVITVDAVEKMVRLFDK
jgi:hypothetical protein